MKFIRLYRILKYWIKSLNTENCILKAAYNNLVLLNNTLNSCSKNWIGLVRKSLNDLGFGNLWISQNVVNEKHTLSVIKQRIFDQARQTILNEIQTSSKCMLYKQVVDDISLKFYLSKNIPPHYKKSITKLRLLSLNLETERGRYYKIERNNRICKHRKIDIEDEYHFMLICPLFQEFRKKYIKIYYRRNPSVFKFIQLMRTENIKDLINIGKYIYISNKLKVSDNLL